MRRYGQGSLQRSHTMRYFIPWYNRIFLYHATAHRMVRHKNFEPWNNINKWNPEWLNSKT
jgi:hypothetical protein